MSANLDLVRSIFAAWERGDYGGGEWAHPEVEWAFADGPAPTGGVGFAEAVQAWSGWLDAWGLLRVEAEAYRELNNERVLVLSRIVGRGTASGAEVRTIGATVFYVHDGKVTRFIHWSDRDRAFADLGLEK